jgi:hypothetical protein
MPRLILLELDDDLAEVLEPPFRLEGSVDSDNAASVRVHELSPGALFELLPGQVLEVVRLTDEPLRECPPAEVRFEPLYPAIAGSRPCPSGGFATFAVGLAGAAAVLVRASVDAEGRLELHAEGESSATGPSVLAMLERSGLTWQGPERYINATPRTSRALLQRFADELRTAPRFLRADGFRPLVAKMDAGARAEFADMLGTERATVGNACPLVLEGLRGAHRGPDGEGNFARAFRVASCALLELRDSAPGPTFGVVVDEPVDDEDTVDDEVELEGQVDADAQLLGALDELGGALLDLFGDAVVTLERYEERAREEGLTWEGVELPPFHDMHGGELRGLWRRLARRHPVAYSRFSRASGRYGALLALFGDEE